MVHVRMAPSVLKALVHFQTCIYAKEWVYLDKMIFYNKKESKKIEKLTFHDEHEFDFYGGAIQSYQRPFQKLWDGGKFHPQQLSRLRCLFFLQDLTLCRSLGPAKTLQGGDPSHERCNQTKLQEQFRILMRLFYQIYESCKLSQRLFSHQNEEVLQSCSQCNRH